MGDRCFLNLIKENYIKKKKEKEKKKKRIFNAWHLDSTVTTNASS